MVLSYRHGFHAGNFADVVKHSALSLLLSHFHLKPTPFYYLDTHAGGPVYNLRADVAAQKTREFAAGVSRIWTARHYPRELEPYLSCLRTLNQFRPGSSSSKSAAGASSIGYATGEVKPEVRRRTEFAWSHLLHSQGFTPSSTAPLPHFESAWPTEAFNESGLELYPGSSLLASFFARQASLREPGRTLLEGIADRAVLCELHPNEFKTLKAFYDTTAPTEGSDEAALAAAAAAAAANPSTSSHILSQATRSRIHCMNQSGFDGLVSTNNKVFLAPPQGRGLVLVDPPYESADEMTQLLSALPTAYNRFRNGVFAIWYPLIDYSPGSPQKLDVSELKSKLRAMGIPKMLCVEFDMTDSVRANRTGISPEAARVLPTLDEPSVFSADRRRGLGMVGTGLIVVNPSRDFESQMHNLCSFLVDALPTPATVDGDAASTPQSFRAKYTIEWLAREQAGAAKATRVVPPPLKGRAKKKADAEAAALAATAPMRE